MVCQRVADLVLQRLDTAAASVLRFAAFRVDCRVELKGVCLEEGEGRDQLVDGRGERRRTAWIQPDILPVMKMSWCGPPLFCSGKRVGPLEFGG